MKWIKASERLPKNEVYPQQVCWRFIATKETVRINSYWTERQLEVDDADLLGESVGTLINKSDVEWLDESPDPTPSSAEVYRKALEGVCENLILGNPVEADRVAREALSHSSQPEQKPLWKGKVLMRSWFFVDANILGKGTYMTADPFFYPVDYSIGKLLQTHKDIQKYSGQSDEYISEVEKNLKECRMEDVVIYSTTASQPEEVKRQ